MRQDEGPTGLLRRWVETSNTSLNGTGALCVVAKVAVTRSVPSLKDLSDRLTYVAVNRSDADLEAGGELAVGIPRPATLLGRALWPAEFAARRASIRAML
ncbi:hypothetical protein SGFS_042790 [Streptomyces graminofaciens]|uniref:Uncharacterized protein n=1 Tax=Streptomyces graminofaciens TaxID=68212 RepID=A0ABM7FAE8_9ACTN|nr:hypothetical protein SGFS_042790 [Streptomyces graminofaciens]